MDGLDIVFNIFLIYLVLECAFLISVKISNIHGSKATYFKERKKLHRKQMKWLKKHLK